MHSDRDFWYLRYTDAQVPSGPFPRASNGSLKRVRWTVDESDRLIALAYEQGPSSTYWFVLADKPDRLHWGDPEPIDGPPPRVQEGKRFTGRHFSWIWAWKKNVTLLDSNNHEILHFEHNAAAGESPRNFKPNIYRFATAAKHLITSTTRIILWQEVNPAICFKGILWTPGLTGASIFKFKRGTTEIDVQPTCFGLSESLAEKFTPWQMCCRGSQSTAVASVFVTDSRGQRLLRVDPRTATAKVIAGDGVVTRDDSDKVQFGPGLGARFGSLQGMTIYEPLATADLFPLPKDRDAVNSSAFLICVDRGGGYITTASLDKTANLQPLLRAQRPSEKEPIWAPEERIVLPETDAVPKNLLELSIPPVADVVAGPNGSILLGTFGQPLWLELIPRISSGQVPGPKIKFRNVGQYS